MKAAAIEWNSNNESYEENNKCMYKASEIWNNNMKKKSNNVKREE